MADRASLSKHHGLGNDFLILLDDLGSDEELARSARRWCDRRRGVGADGLIAAHPADDQGTRRPGGLAGTGPEPVVMVLHNADGGRAEMSGNGIRCFAQALVRRWGIDAEATEIGVHTDAGLRVVAIEPADEAETHRGRVGMGRVTLRGDLVDEATLPDGTQPGARAAVAEVGNPHLVVLDDGETDVVALGRANPDRNVEVITTDGGGAIRLAVWERGVGRTEACGTGACAAAAVARSWGLAGDTAQVTMPGGTVQVHLDAAGEATLSGPTTWIADLTVAR